MARLATRLTERLGIEHPILSAPMALAGGGALAAGRRNMDLFGVSLIAFLTALGGGTVRDTGKEVLFSAHDKAAGDAARQYAVKKWGKGLRLEGNTLRRDVLPERDGEPERVQEREQQKRRGMER